MKAQSKGTVSNEMNYLSVLRAAKSMEGGVDIEGVYPGDSPAAFITFLSADDYNRIFGTNFQLGDNEAVLGLVKGTTKCFGYPSERTIDTSSQRDDEY